MVLYSIRRYDMSKGKFELIQGYKAQIEYLTMGNPELKEFQSNLEISLHKCKSTDEKMNLLQNLLETKARELAEALNDLNKLLGEKK
jgi:hypothetical protein